VPGCSTEGVSLSSSVSLFVSIYRSKLLVEGKKNQNISDICNVKETVIIPHPIHLSLKLSHWAHYTYGNVYHSTDRVFSRKVMSLCSF
jgi:hypothetical protein